MPVLLRCSPRKQARPAGPVGALGDQLDVERRQAPVAQLAARQPGRVGLDDAAVVAATGV